MTEAAQAVVDYGFQFGLGAIGWAAEVHAGEPNYASLRVAEKLGFVQDGKFAPTSSIKANFTTESSPRSYQKHTDSQCLDLPVYNDTTFVCSSKYLSCAVKISTTDTALSCKNLHAKIAASVQCDCEEHHAQQKAPKKQNAKPVTQSADFFATTTHFNLSNFSSTRFCRVHWRMESQRHQCAQRLARNVSARRR